MGPGKMCKRFFLNFSMTLIVFFAAFLDGCEKKNQQLIVYSGQGLEKVMEELIQDFENRYNLSVKVIYAGSETLLHALTKSKMGDVFIPGSDRFIEKAGDLVLHHQYVSLHVPIIVVHRDNPKNIRSFENLLDPGVKIAIGRKNMCAMGKVSEEIINASPKPDEFIENISITASTVNELLDLVLQKEVDASLVWSDMKLWSKSKNLEFIEIPPDINKPRRIHIAVLSTTTDQKNATLFANYVATEGRTLFSKHGFGENI